MYRNSEDGSYLTDLADGVLSLTFNRPEHGNAVPSTAVPGLTQMFQQAQTDQSVRCVLVRGRGKVFSAGGDVGGFAKALKQETAERRADFSARLGRLAVLVQSVIAFDRPIVAAIRGAVAGAGLLYPLAADYAVGDESATFVFAHQRVGLSPDGGVSFLLPQVVGTRTARTLLLTAAKLDAQEAFRLGILSRIVSAEELDTDALTAARRFAAAPQCAVRWAKRLVNAAAENSPPEQLQAEREGIVECVGDPDFKEGVTAFIEKRKTDFPSTYVEPPQSRRNL
jgi:2-(1,2-epoxy-1,2-dihydrophenyl)acetyl-CoA isomerase